MYKGPRSGGGAVPRAEGGPYPESGGLYLILKFSKIYPKIPEAEMEPGHRVAGSPGHFGSLLRPGHRVRPNLIQVPTEKFQKFGPGHRVSLVTFAIGSPGHYLLTQFHL